MFAKLLSLVLITFSVTLFLKVVTCRPQMDYYQPIQFHNSFPIIDCAKIWNNVDYCGHYIDVSQHQVVQNLGISNFVPFSAQIRPNCSLNIYSNYGLEVVVNTSTNWLWQCGKMAVETVCCECDFGECAGAKIPSGEDSCAVVYQQSQCLICNGFHLEVKDKDQFAALGDVNNQISSIMVKPGCKLTIYDEDNFLGNSATLINVAEYLPKEWEDNISSLQCFCDDTTTTTTTTVPPTTTTKVPPTTTTTVPPTTTTTTLPPTTTTTAEPTVTTIEPTTMTTEATITTAEPTTTITTTTTTEPTTTTTEPTTTTTEPTTTTTEPTTTTTEPTTTTTEPTTTTTEPTTTTTEPPTHNYNMSTS